MDVEVVLLEELSVDAELLVVRHNPLVGDGCRLLHHVAKVTRKVELALTWGEDRLDVEDVTTHLGPCKACHHATHASDVVAVVLELRLAQDCLDV